jgi:hypothetical protein
MRESFDDRIKRPEYDWRDKKMMMDRLAHRPFWLNQSRTFWRRQLPFWNSRHWQLLAQSQTSPGWTARACYVRWSINR